MTVKRSQAEETESSCRFLRIRRTSIHGERAGLIRLPVSCGVLILFIMLTAFAQERWKVEEVIFQGNRVLSNNQLLDLMQTRPARLWDRTEYSFDQLEQDISEIETYYRIKGYRRAEVEIDRIVRDPRRRRVTIALIVREGPLTTIDSISIRGIHALTRQEAAQALGVSTGDPFDSLRIEEGRRALRDSLRVRAYLLSTVGIEYRINGDRDRVDLPVSVDEGPMVVAGEIRTTGLNRIRDRVVRRELAFTPGDTLTQARVDESTRRVYATTLFDYMRIEPLDTTHNSSGPSVLPVNVDLREAPQLFFEGGGGYTSIDGFFISAQSTYVNLFGLGHRIGVRGKLSEIAYGGTTFYTYPWLFSLPVNADLLLYAERRLEPDLDGLFYGGIIGLGRPFRQFAYRVWTRLEWTQFIQPPAPELEITRGEPGLTHSIAAAVNRDTRRSIFDPGLSSYLYTEAEIAGLFGVGTTRFYRLVADVRGYVPIGNRLRLASALYGGYIAPYGDDPGPLPARELFRFGLGQVRIVRGYDEEELFAGDEDVVVRGGSVAFIANPLEVTIRIIPTLNLAFFVDAGFVWQEVGQVNPGDLRWSGGIGIRVRLPIGLIRLDYGVPIGEDAFPGRLHFEVGLPF